MSISKIRTSDGAEHGIDYEGLENKPAVLGEPIHVKRLALTENARVDNNTDLELDFSSYLPNDEECYMVLVRFWGSTTGEGKFITAMFTSSLDTSPVYGGCIQSYDPSYPMLNGTTPILIGPDRKATVVKHNNSNYFGTLNIAAIRYQKVNVIID